MHLLFLPNIAMRILKTQSQTHIGAHECIEAVCYVDVRATL